MLTGERGDSAYRHVPAFFCNDGQVAGGVGGGGSCSS